MQSTFVGQTSRPPLGLVKIKWPEVMIKSCATEADFKRRFKTINDRTTKAGTPYVEPHHIRRLSNDGRDVPVLHICHLTELRELLDEAISDGSDVPTLAESGLERFDVALWLGMAAPAGVPSKVAGKITREISDILSTTDMRDAMMHESFVVEPSSPADLAGRIGAGMEKWRNVVTAARAAAL